MDSWPDAVAKASVYRKLLLDYPLHGVRGALPEAVVALLNGFLPTPAFLSQQEIDRRLERTHTA